MKDLLKYRGFIENALKEKFAYKFRTFIWSISSFMFLLIQFYLWKAIFQSSDGELAGISIESYIVYVGIGFFTYNLTSCFLELNISEEVKKGDVANHLLKPFSYAKMTFARHLGNKFAELITLIPILIVVVCMFDFKNVKMLYFGLYLISLTFTFILAFLVSYLVGILCFWVKNVWGLHLLKTSLVVIFSGQMLAIDLIRYVANTGVTINPLGFISDEMIKNLFSIIEKISFALPFQAMYYTPTAIFSGLISTTETAIKLILLQIFWVFILFIVNKIVWKCVSVRIDILGG